VVTAEKSIYEQVVGIILFKAYSNSSGNDRHSSPYQIKMTVIWIRDILRRRRIRILGSVHWITDPDLDLVQSQALGPALFV